MKFDIITLFPKAIEFYFDQGLISRARKQGLIEIKAHDLRCWTDDKHRTVDDKPYGGGSGMVLKVEPIYRAVSEIKGRSRKSKVVLLTPRGKQFNQKMAKEYADLKQLIIISGRYEGVDQRVAENIADEEISIGPYVLMSGDLPAMSVVETVVRLKAGVAGEKEWLSARIQEGGFWEGPQYTRPEIFRPKKGKLWKVPSVLMKGNHRDIEKWRKEHGRLIEGDKLC